MRKVPFLDSLRIIGRGSLNWPAGRPIVLSFEVTDACSCHCRHCDHGGPRDESRNLKPADYRRYMEVLRPCVVQVSGGEPLLRNDVVEIVRNIKQDSGVPYTILVSNWSHMTEEKYLELRAAGVDQFSVSLDFPDERHDDFRSYPGLYAHLAKLVPRLASLGHDDIVLNSCITSANLAEINRLADKAREWGVNICYSSYSARRTGCRDYSLTTPGQLALLNRELDQVESAPRCHQLDRELAFHAGCYPPLLRTRRRPGLQGWSSFPGGDQRRLAAALLDGLPTLPAGRARPHGRGVHQEQYLRRVLCLHPLLSRQDLSPAALGKCKRIPLGQGGAGSVSSA